MLRSYRRHYTTNRKLLQDHQPFHQALTVNYCSENNSLVLGDYVRDQEGLIFVAFTSLVEKIQRIIITTDKKIP